MDEVALRTPRDDDWQAILDLANQSLAEVPNAQPAGVPGQPPLLFSQNLFRAANTMQRFASLGGDLSVMTRPVN